MAAGFRMSNLNLLTFGEARRDSITLCQRAYVGKLLERSGMADCKLCTTPMERLKPSKASTTVKVDVTCYRSIVGGLR